MKNILEFTFYVLPATIWIAAIVIMIVMLLGEIYGK